MPKKQKSPAPTQDLVLNNNRCRFTTIDGRQCRMYRSKKHKSLCLTHAQQEEQMLNAEAVAAELIGPVEDYQTALCVNRTLGCLFNMIAQKRISNKDGALLAYIAQMLLQSVGSTVKDEFIRISSVHRPAAWDANVRRAVEILSDDYSMRHEEPAEDELEAEDEAPPAEEPPEIEVAKEESPQVVAAPAAPQVDVVEALLQRLERRHP